MKERGFCTQKRTEQIPEHQLVMGIHAIQELLNHHPQNLITLYTSANSSAKQRKNTLVEECIKRGVSVQYRSFDALTKMVGSDSHQSFVGVIKKRIFIELREFLEHHEHSLVVMLDQIFDPQNFGSILRGAECLGVDAVVWSKNRGCDVTPLVTKTSCGASELLPLIRVSNLASSVDLFKEAGYEVVASVSDPKARSIFETTPAQKTLLIIGSEGEGIQPLLLKKADHFCFIPLKGRIESLNAAQAASILFAWFSRNKT